MQPMDMNTMNIGTMTEESMDMDSMAIDKEDMKSMQDSDMSMQKTINILAMPMNSDWNLNDLIVMALMWIVMMFAMMMPTTFNFLYLFHQMRTNMASTHNQKTELVILASTYFLLWILFSLLAVTLQYLLHNANIVDMMGVIKNNDIAGILIIGAGVYQFTSLKNICLEKCRNPLSYIMGTKIDGMGSIVKIGLSNGIFCIGCCWILMLLLFVNGVMNLLWVLIITIAVLAEKVFPYGNIISKLFGVGLLSWGCLLIYF
jgi:predicted metal-binding membrane protein